jgi:hypothetical protein
MGDEERDDGNEQGLPTASDLLRWAERTQRTIDFMVQQQAQFQGKSETDMQRLRELYEQNEERWARSDERWARADERWERTREQILALLAVAEMHEREIFELREAQARNAEAQARTDAQMAETDERLNALINAVEKRISERRNGGQREEGSG